MHKGASSLVERSTKMGSPRNHKGAVDDEIHHTKPQFFTIIVSPSLQLHKLRLPTMFVKEHGKQLSNLVHLRVPNEPYWVVEILKHKGNIWLHTGWNQFAQNYSISIGYLLVFKYYGNSQFRVLIFNTSTLQIDYSPNNLHQSANQTSNSQAIKIEDTNEDQQTEGESDEKLAKQRKNVVRVAKERVQQRADTFQSANKTEDSDEDESDEQTEGESDKYSVKQRNAQRANDFDSPNPHFKVEMKRRNFKGNSGPVMPVSHGRLYVRGNKKREKLVLRVKDKTWPINCTHHRAHSRPFDVALSNGWQKFVLENALQVGDGCLFELVDIETMTYNVQVNRVSKAAPKLIDGKRVTPGSGGKKVKLDTATRCKTAPVIEVVEEERLMKKAEDFVNGSPGRFTITMRESYIDALRPVHVPHYHSKEYMKEEGAIVVHGKDEESWKIEYLKEKSGPSLRGPGWRKFKSDNDLKIGDVCAFKLINRVKKAYRVVIFRFNGK